MPQEDKPLLEETIEHFRRIARENRFAENAAVPHDADRCLVCRPEKASLDPFTIYVEVVARSIPERRPALDEDLVAAVNEDLALYGEAKTITLDDLQQGKEGSDGGLAVLGAKRPGHRPGAPFRPQPHEPGIQPGRRPGPSGPGAVRGGKDPVHHGLHPGAEGRIIPEPTDLFVPFLG